jgi:uncharacterized protein (DUF58 family)
MRLPRWLAWVDPGRTIWPTRDGWWCLAAAVSLGFAAMNTGNNLLYLLASLLLGVIIVSGIFSEQSMRRVRLTPVVPDEIYAGRPAAFGASVANHKRWRTSYSLTLEITGADGVQRMHVDRVPPGEARMVTWEATLPARGRRRLPGVRLTTRFPFGLFVKAGRVQLDREMVVFPAIGPVPAERRRELSSGGPRPLRRRGRGHDLYNLRDYRAGDDPRLIHWRSSAKSDALVVRELQADTSEDTRIVLEGTGARDPARLERGLSEAASLALHLVRAGARVELVGPGVFVPLGRGRGHARRLLTALALYEPGRAARDGEPVRAARAATARELRVPLG